MEPPDWDDIPAATSLEDYGYNVVKLEVSKPLKPCPVWIDSDDWDEAEIPKRPWVVPGYLMRGAVTLLSGPPSAFKSSLILAYSTAMALCVEFGLFRPKEPTKTLIYNVEDDQTEQRRRLSATLRHFSASTTDIRDIIIRVGPLGAGTLFERGDTGRLRPTSTMEALIELIRIHKPSCVVVDPFTELHNVEENDNTAMRTVIAAFRSLAIEHDTAVVILHHTRKGASAAAGDPEAARGASAIIGAVRIAMTLTGMTLEDADALGVSNTPENRSRYVRLDDAKSNYAPLTSARWFEKAPHMLDNGEEVVAAVPWVPDPPKQASLNDLLDLVRCIQKGSPNGQPWSRKLDAKDRSLRAPLKQHGFDRADEQNAVIAILEVDHGMTNEIYKTPQRKEAHGLRIAGLPHAPWQDE